MPTAYHFYPCLETKRKLAGWKLEIHHNIWLAGVEVHAGRLLVDLDKMRMLVGNRTTRTIIAPGVHAIAFGFVAGSDAANVEEFSVRKFTEVRYMALWYDHKVSDHFVLFPDFVGR